MDYRGASSDIVIMPIYYTYHCITPVLTHQTQGWHQTDRTITKNLSCIVTQSTVIITQSTHDKVLELRSQHYLLDHAGMQTRQTLSKLQKPRSVCFPQHFPIGDSVEVNTIGHDMIDFRVITTPYWLLVSTIGYNKIYSQVFSNYIIVRLQNTGIYKIYNPKGLGCGVRVKRGCY